MPAKAKGVVKAKVSAAAEKKAIEATISAFTATVDQGENAAIESEIQFVTEQLRGSERLRKRLVGLMKEWESSIVIVGLKLAPPSQTTHVTPCK